MSSNVRYDPSLRKQSKATGKPLVTLQAGGMTLQFPATEGESKQIVNLMYKFFRERVRPPE